MTHKKQLFQRPLGNVQVCRILISGCMLLLFLSTSSFAQLSNGIYAVFDTSMGGITARLDYVKAPMTVANFIGLAEGTQTWYDENEGVPRNEPFYNGTIVNRIAALDTRGTRIVQAGSRNGTSSGGGPGYTFRDEFDGSLRHDRPGVISMANSGKNSNGSQYFFSLGSLPHLDDVHSVFGEVISGLNVLTNISEVPLTNSKPETDVVFDQINILRVGQDASNFVITGHGLPVVTSLPVRISSASTNMVVLNCQPHQNSLFGFSLSTTLSRWFLVKTVWDTDVRVATNWYLDPTWKLCFCSGIRVDYPDRIYTPSTGYGYHYSASEKIFDVYLDVDSNTGTVYLSPETETNIISSWSWVPDAFRSVLCIDCDNTNYPHCELKLNFTNSYMNDYLFVEYGRERTNSISGTFTYERFAP